MKMKTIFLFLAVVLSACHRDQGTTSTTSTSSTPVYSVEYYMDHMEERRARMKMCATYEVTARRADENCRHAFSATLGKGDI
jgi:outer membrane PBP1 activator LpoA protein